MTAIQQSSITAHQSQNRTEGDVAHAGIQAINSSTGEPNSSTVNISWQAVMRLSAFEQHREYERGNGKDYSDTVFPEHISTMLSEIEQNLVQSTEPGYKHLQNLLNNQSEVLSEPGQLQEVVRKEKFFLGRRKAFMDSSEFQSYSQVLNQFSNIIQREFAV